MQLIFLVGPMGVGKTTIGRHLSETLSWDFVDLDQEIEDLAGANIPWIFDLEGEDGFREREHHALQSLCDQTKKVIATGGGVVISKRNRKLLIDNGFVVWLCADIETLVKRTKGDSNRPLLNQEDPVRVQKDLISLRTPWYKEVADYQQSTEELPAKIIAKKIAEVYINEQRR